MTKKQDIFDNVGMYTVEEIVKHIKDGLYTYEELCDETSSYMPKKTARELEAIFEGGKPAPAKANIQLEKKTEKPEKQAPEASTPSNQETKKDSKTSSVDEKRFWEGVNKDSIPALRKFVETYPKGKHTKEARRRINELTEKGFDQGTIALLKEFKKIQDDKSYLNKDEAKFTAIVSFLEEDKISHEELVGLMRNDNNLLSANIVRRLLNESYIDYSDFDKANIKKAFAQQLKEGERPKALPKSTPLTQIKKMSTEVYFWGIPSSGKSCALGAILSAANSGKAETVKSMKQNNECQGYGYMNQLASLFKGDSTVGTLPEGTSTTSTYEMGFDLEGTDNKEYPITCIDLAGELVRCMYKNDAKQDMTEEEKATLKTLTNIMIDNRTKNRKMHFFVVEYGAENREYEGLKQDRYLDGALRYIEKTGIFKKDTDAIFFMLTKVDKAKAEKGQLATVLKEYINEHYAAFYNGLEKVCRDCEINGGKVETVPFSLGEVCFQDYCMFDVRPASNVLKTIQKHAIGFNTGFMAKILNIFKK